MRKKPIYAGNTTVFINNFDENRIKMNRKLTTTCLLLGLSLGSMAQNQTDTIVPRNKKGHEILPKTGDIGLGFNTIPILDMFLGTLNRATPFAGASNIVQYTQSSNNQLVGKYYLAPKTAIRVRFGMNTISGSMIAQVQDAKAAYDASFGTPDDIAKASLMRVDDKATFQKSNLLLSAGLEFRRGYRRLQGFYGAEIGFGQTSARQTVVYGNTFSDQYNIQYTNFQSGSTVLFNPNTTARTSRDVETRFRGGIRIGARAFVGIEYFIFAKISIAAEYGWGYSFTTRRAATTIRQVYNNGQNGPELFNETVDTDSREVTKGFSVDNNNGSVFSMSNTLNGSTSLNGGSGALTLIFHF